MQPADKRLMICTGAAMATLVPVAARQLGWISHLPDPPSVVFASDEITGSRMAHPFGIPDSLLGFCSYALTMGLAVTAVQRQETRPLLVAKVLGDGAIAGFNTVRQVTRFGKLCSWCMATVFFTVGMVVSVGSRE